MTGQDSSFWKRRVRRRTMIRGGAFGATGVAAALLVGCGSDDEGDSAGNGSSATAPAGGSTATATSGAGGPRRGGSIVVNSGIDKAGLFPHTGLASATNTTNQLFYDSLGDMQEDGSIQPSLATSWEFTEDGQEIVVQLREGVKFTDGTDFTSEAVLLNVPLDAEPEFASPAALAAKQVESLEAVDDYTVRIRLVQPSVSWLAQFVDRPGFMVSPTAYAEHGADWFKNNAVGTGPYVLESYEPEVSLKAKRNPDYWHESYPYLDEVEYRPIADQNTAFASVETGQLDWTVITPDLFASQGGRTDITVSSGMYGGWRISAFDLSEQSRNPALTHDVRVRQAFGHAIDRQAIYDTIYYGSIGQVGYTPVSPVFQEFHDPTIQKPEYDLTKAKALLDAAGYSDGFEFDAFVGRQATAEHQLFQAQIAEVGMKMNIVTDPVPHVKFFTEHATEFWFSGWSGRADPYFPLLLTFGAGAQYNPGITDPVVGEILTTADTLPDTAARKEKYSELTNVLIDNAYCYFWWYPSQISAGRKGLKTTVYADSQPRWYKQWLEEA